MKPYIASLINALLLLGLSLWGYFDSELPSLTALIPAVFGAVILLLNSGLRKENRVTAHIVVILTFLIAVALIMPLLGAIERNDNVGIFRVGLMLLSSVVALFTFIHSFVRSRRGIS
ncbi:MAG: hypothetical protein OXC03_05780 [Flavobacteriaceae bacterium]|nr:hypothetical protein [Flavobacteriaceae bacterium]